jgi:phage terminase large subunit GpA-like protein
MEPMRAVMDAVNDPATREVVVKKSTQIGYTEALLNTIGYYIDLEPCPILWLLPDQKAVEEISKNRLQPMLRDTPRLAGKVKAPRTRDSNNTIAGKQFPGGRLAIVGSHAPNDISSRPIRVVIEDETDRYALSAGVDGDPMALAAKRQAWFWNRKTIKGSSPTTKGRSVIERDYRASDMRECYIACPHCDERQTLRWSQVRWDKRKDDTGKTAEHFPETAAYQCEACGTLWDDADRIAALTNKPEWRASAPFRGIAGFHYPQFLSTVVKLADIVTEFLTAYGKLPGTFPDVQKQKVWVNTVLAETWEEAAETVDGDALERRAEPYGPNDLPEGALIATAGVDVQDNRLEAQIIAWGPGEETFPARYVVIDGDPAQRQVWDELDALLKEPLQTASGRFVRIKAACIDTGGHHANAVHEFCKGKMARRIYPIKGRGGPERVWPVRSSRAKNNNRVWLVGVDTGKDTIYGRLKIKPHAPERSHLPRPGLIHFPLPNDATGTAGFNTDYYGQLTAERVETRYREGKPYRVWVLPPGKRNEALDTFVYALAARMSLAHIKLRAPTPSEMSDDDAPAPRPAPAVIHAPPPRDVPSPVLAPAKPAARGRIDPASVARMFRR